MIAAGQSSPYFHNQCNFKGNTITISSSGAYAGYVWYHYSPIWASDCHSLEGLLLTKYLYYILKSQQDVIYKKQSGSGQPHIYLKDLEALQIPLPSIEEQQKIVEELDSYQKMIEGAKQIIDNWKPFFEIDKNWEYTELSELIDFIRGFSYKSTVLAEKGIPMYNLKSVKKDLSFDYSFKFVNSEIKIQDKYKCFKGELLIAITDLTPTSEIISRATIVNKEGIFSMDLAKIRIKTDVILSKYLYYILNSEVYLINARKFSVGNNVKHLNLNSVLSIRIPLPALNIQQEIIEQIEKERTMIEANKETIKLFENKLKTKLNSLWQ